MLRRHAPTLAVALSLALAPALIAACGGPADPSANGGTTADGGATTTAPGGSGAAAGTEVAGAGGSGADGSTTGTGPATPGTDTTGQGGATDPGPPTTAGTDPSGAPLPTRPPWLGSRVLPTTPDGDAVTPQTTPAELIDRRFATIDTLPPPAGDAFVSTVAPLAGDALARSTWQEGCPVTVDELRYLTLTFLGFDGRPHTGELIVNAEVADDVVAAFRALYEARYPIEEMRITTRAELDAPPIGDGNNTGAFVCRPAVGSTRFSEHAYGLAVDINPFHNPYIKGDVVLPELAAVYTDRTDVRPGMITEGDAVVDAFDAIGWGWGGRWDSLKDYQHFSLRNR